MTLTLAVSQMACTWDRAANLDKAAALIVEAASSGARLILLQELFEQNDIKFAHRQVTVRIADEDMDKPDEVKQKAATG